MPPARRRSQTLEQGETSLPRLKPASPRDVGEASSMGVGHRSAALVPTDAPRATFLSATLYVPPIATNHVQ